MKTENNKTFLNKVKGYIKWTIKHEVLALSPAQRRVRTRWLKHDGIELLKRIGIKPGDTVVDFGCGPGSYTIPAALLVGAEGLVVAVDEKPLPVRKLKRVAVGEGLGNIRAARSVEEMRKALDGRRSCDAVLLFDVMHYMDKDTRRGLYSSFRSVLTPGGILAVHPKHLKDDSFPSQYLSDMTLDDVVREIEEAGFVLKEKSNVQLWHDSESIPGRLLTFYEYNNKTNER